MDNELKSNELKQKNRKYYMVKSEGLASTLQWITGQRPYTFKDKNKTDGSVVYSFLYDETFNEALSTLYLTREKLHRKY